MISRRSFFTGSFMAPILSSAAEHEKKPAAKVERKIGDGAFFHQCTVHVHNSPIRMTPDDPTTFSQCLFTLEKE